MANNINNSDNNDKINKKYFQHFEKIFKNKYKTYKKQPSFENFNALKNTCLHFMIFLVNIKCETNLLELIFKNNTKIVKLILSTIKLSLKFPQISNITNIFYFLISIQYKQILNEYGSEQLYTTLLKKIKNINLENVKIYSKSEYELLLEKILSVDLSYYFLNSQVLNLKEDEREISK